MMAAASAMPHEHVTAYLSSAHALPPLTHDVDLHPDLQRLVDACLIDATEARRMQVYAQQHCQEGAQGMAQQLCTYIIKHLRMHREINPGYARWSWLESKVLEPLCKLRAVVNMQGPLKELMQVVQTRVRLCMWHTLKAIREHCGSNDTLVSAVQSLRAAADVPERAHWHV